MQKKFVKRDYTPGFPPNILLDVEDYIVENKYHWRIAAQGYVVRVIGLGGGRCRRIWLHREIAARMIGRPLISGSTIEQVDHVNGNKLDNRRINLRVVDGFINGQNRTGAMKNNKTCSALGVTWNPLKKQWYSRMQIYGHRFHLGYYDNIGDAISIAREARERWASGYANDCYEEFE